MVDDLLKKSDKAKNDLEAQIEKVVKKIMKKMNLASREDIFNLTERIKKLDRALKEKGSQD